MEDQTPDTTDPNGGDAAARAKFRSTLVRVLIVQAIALAFLGFLQITYSG